MNADGTDPDDMGALVAIATVPDDILAVKISEALLQQRFAACVHAMPAGISRYRWQGKIEANNEIMLIIKTSVARYPEVEAEIVRHHSYEVPEIVALPVSAGLPGYLNWIENETR